MMKNFILIFFSLIALSCSFDNKTGIWKDASQFPIDNQITESIDGTNIESKYENIFTQNQIFNEEKNSFKNLNIILDDPVKINNWFEQYVSLTNNVSNFSYKGSATLVSKSPKLSKLSLNKNIIFYKNNLISHDHKGKIFIYSLKLKKKIFEYNFYKKNFKNFKKEIYLIINNNRLYAGDNLGYLYAIDLKKKTLIWAKNYGIPFRSNLKVANDQIFLVNQDNVIYSINVRNGLKNWKYSTTLTFLKSDFENNLAVDELNNNIFFLNTSGELYSINYLNKNINWVINFKNSSLASDTELFFSQPIVINNNNIIVTTENAVMAYDPLVGAKKWSFPSDSILKPILTSNYTYIVSKNNLLICLENSTGKVLWSKNIYKKIQNKKIKSKIGSIFYDFKIVNNSINLYSNNGYLLSFNYENGNFQYIKKISKNGINSEIVFLRHNMFLFDNHNKLLKFN